MNLNLINQKSKRSFVTYKTIKENLIAQIHHYFDSKLNSFFSGGHAQNRTGIQGFAILCVTIPPRGQIHNKH